MLTYDLTERGKIAIYDYLYRKIRDDILSGKLKEGEKLPSKRSFAENLGVSVITVENAYAQLMAEGYISSRERSCFFVEKVLRRKENSPSANAIEKEEKPKSFKSDFTYNKMPEKSFPFSVWAKLMRETLIEEGEKSAYAESSFGAYELRSAISDYLYRSRGVNVSPENVVIGAGTEYICTMLVRLFSRDSVFGVEDPGYKKTFLIYDSNEVICRRLPMDKHGLELKALQKSDVNVLHITPTHHYPTGIVTPIGRRQEILHWADERADRFIIEDDYDSEFRFSGRPIPTLKSIDEKGKVVYINTFSKSLAPAMRISYMLLPDELLKKYKEKLGFYSCPVPAFEQYTLAKFISRGYFERHLSRMKTVYKKRREEIFDRIDNLECRDKLTVIPTDSGLHFLLKVNSDISDKELIARAKDKGVLISCLSDYSHLMEKKYSHFILINYSGINSVDLDFLDEILK